MNEVASKLGSYAAIAAFIATVAYGLAQIAQILNIASYPLADILIYGASLCISAPFLIAILALHDTVDSPNRLWTSGALLFGAPQTLFWTIDGLGNVSMGVSTLFAALSLPRAGPGTWARRFMFANAMITPIIAFIYFYPNFSLGILLLGSPWLVTAPGSLLALASYFRVVQSAALDRSKGERSHP